MISSIKPMNGHGLREAEFRNLQPFVYMFLK